MGMFLGIIFALIAISVLGIIALFFSVDRAAEREQEEKNKRL
jgi:uncharacterized alpha/beta hydrolase family protein